MLDTHCEKRLRIEGLNAFYGDSHVLHGIDLHVERGELVTLLGRNGAGKTTTLRAIMGLVERRGDIRFDGADLSRLPPHKIARFGIGYVPEERGIFSSLDVTENLLLPPTIKPGGMTIEEIYTLFPNLKERAGSQGTKLSGGEQQMLAMARILRTGADFLLLDEVTEGGAGHHRADRHRDRASQGAGLHDPAGGAELPLCQSHRRPPLRSRERTRGRHGGEGRPQ